MSLIAIAAMPMPASAVDAADYLVWRVWGSNTKAVVLIRNTSQGAGLSMALKGLESGDQFRVVGTNADGDCSSPVTNANRTLSYQNEYAGGASYDMYRASVGNAAVATRFIRIQVVGQGTWACAATRRYEAAPGPGGLVAGSYVFNNGSRQLIIIIEALPNSQARATLALMRPDDGAMDLTLTLRNAKCARSGSAIKQLGFFDIPAELFVTRTFNMTQTQFDSIKSMRFSGDSSVSGKDWAVCRDSFVTDLIIDPLAH